MQEFPSELGGSLLEDLLSFGTVLAVVTEMMDHNCLDRLVEMMASGSVQVSLGSVTE